MTESREVGFSQDLVLKVPGPTHTLLVPIDDWDELRATVSQAEPTLPGWIQNVAFLFFGVTVTALFSWVALPDAPPGQAVDPNLKVRVIYIAVTLSSFVVGALFALGGWYLGKGNAQARASTATRMDRLRARYAPPEDALRTAAAERLDQQKAEPPSLPRANAQRHVDSSGSS